MLTRMVRQYRFYFQNALYLQHIRNNMNYLEFRNKMYDLACFSIDQVYA